MTQAASDSLLWIKSELDSTFTQARHGLEAFVEEEQREGLDDCLRALRQAHGTLRMVEVYGAAMLGEEMEALGRAIADGTVNDRDTALEVLSRGLLQLPDYLERIIGGQPDVPLALLSLINDMRASRGRPLLSESAIFARDIGDRRLSEKVARPGTGSGDSKELAQKLRGKFQKALLGWYRNPDAAKNPKVMGKIAEKLEEAAESPPVFQLWWVVGGALEALAHGGLEADVSFKQLIGRVDREIKRLATEGEEAVQANPPEELINNLLYYIARASAGGERVQGIRESFGLEELLPDEERVRSVEDALSGPNAALMQTVSSAVKEDLARVKDILDIHVRTGQSDPGELEPLAELLRKVSDTLGMLGLDHLKERVASEQGNLQKMVSGDITIDDNSLMQTASALLDVEQRLDRQMAGLASGRSDIDDDGQDEAVSGAVIRECIVNLAKVKGSVQDFVKSPDKRDKLENIPQLVQQIRAGLGLLGLDRAGTILQAASLFVRDRIFGSDTTPPPESLDRLADAIVSTEFYLETIQQGRGRPESMLDNAEHCISELGYRPGALPGDAAAGGPPAGDRFPESTDSEEIVLESPAGDSDDDFDADPDVIPDPTAELNEERSTQSESADAESASAEPAPPAAPPARKKVPPADEIAPEIVEIFLEEADEELASLREHFPRWRDNPKDEDALTTIRRSFHTLKGSGRMVGAEFIGEFSWSFENLLNRVIDQTVEPKPAMVELLGQGVEAIPELIVQLKGEGEPDVDAIGLMEKADAYSRGEEPVPNAAGSAGADAAPSDSAPELHTGQLDTVDEAPDAIEGGSEQPDQDLADDSEEIITIPDVESPDEDGSSITGDSASEETASEEDALDLDGLELEFDESSDDTLNAGLDSLDAELEDGNDLDAEPAMDPVLYDIFRKEADRHLTTVSEEAEAIANDEAAISADLMRALHTLNGSAHTADVAEIPALAAPLEHLAREMQESDVAPDAAFAEILRETVSEIRAMIDGLATPTGAPRPASALLNRIRDLHETLSQPTAATEAEMPDDSSTPVAGTPPPAQRPAAPDRIPLDAMPDYDEELAGVFMEEAIELQEAMDEAIQEWRVERNDAALVAALQHHLHTLKGGARMSGLTPMGDLSHEMETVLTKAVDGKLPVSAEFTSLIQRCVDRVHRMVQQVASGEAMVDGADLVDELMRLDARGGRVFYEEPASEVDDDEEVTPAPPETESAAAPAPAEEREAYDAVSEHGERRGSPRVQQEVVRVRADLLENLLNNAGEVSIYRARVEQQLANMDFHLKELDQTVERLRQQFRGMEIEIEAQVRYQWEKEEGASELEFDPLELDRYSQLQQLSRALQESVSDLVSLQGLLSNHAREAETLLVQQSRVNTDLQDGLMRTRMLPFSRHAQRLRRLVRQTAAEESKKVDLRLIGGEGEMDRQVLERIIAPLEHMLRNSVIHGIETPEERDKDDKPEEGLIAIELHREGSEVVIEVMDDGRGLNVSKIRERAEKLGLVRPGAELSEAETIQYILEPGFSTADKITQSAGRGVGMDVVHSEIKQLGGSFHMTSSEGVGTRFTIRLPYTLAITQALMVNVADEVFAIPLPSIEGIVRIRRDELEQKLSEDDPHFRYGGRDYQLQHLSGMLGFGQPALPDDVSSLPVLLVRVGDYASALVTEGMRGSREVVVKSVGPQIANIRGISGATIMGDGSIVLILDVGGMVRGGVRTTTADMAEQPRAAVDEVPTIMVVDDSITVRRVTERLLKRYGLNVVTAKDGVDALSVLQDQHPDLMLLDIEMPRMDGYELATHMRNDDELKKVPIIMITSRTGDKHRNRAFEIGVDRYLGKPYQETELMENIRSLIGEFDPQRTSVGSD